MAAVTALITAKNKEIFDATVASRIGGYTGPSLETLNAELADMQNQQTTLTNELTTLDASLTTAESSLTEANAAITTA